MSILTGSPLTLADLIKIIILICRPLGLEPWCSFKWALYKFSFLWLIYDDITPSQKPYLFKAGTQQVDSCRLSAIRILIRYWDQVSSAFDCQKKFLQFIMLLHAYNLLMSGVDLFPVLFSWSQSWWGDTWVGRRKGRRRGEGEIGLSSVTADSTECYGQNMQRCRL